MGVCPHRPCVRPGVVVRAEAAQAQASAKANFASTPATDITQALAIAGFLAVRYGNLQFNAELILKSLAVLQLLVAAIALVTRGVHTDRVRVHLHLKHCLTCMVLSIYSVCTSPTQRSLL